MSRSLMSRLAAQPLFRISPVSLLKPSCSFVRPFSITSTQWLDNQPPSSPGSSTGAPKVATRPNSKSLLESMYGSSREAAEKTPPSGSMASLSQSMAFQAFENSSIDTSALSSPGSVRVADDFHEPYHFHIYSHKHNTHITCSKPDRNPIVSMSCGNIGFKKSRRGSFDAAYSLTKYVLERMTHTGWPPKIRRLEVVLRGFGPGRDAAVKVLMSPEGKMLRDKIVRVSDSTRIKFGGTRSEKKRRL